MKLCLDIWSNLCYTIQYLCLCLAAILPEVYCVVSEILTFVTMTWDTLKCVYCLNGIIEWINILGEPKWSNWILMPLGYPVLKWTVNELSRWLSRYTVAWVIPLELSLLWHRDFFSLRPCNCCLSGIFIILMLILYEYIVIMALYIEQCRSIRTYTICNIYIQILYHLTQSSFGLNGHCCVISNW